MNKAWRAAGRWVGIVMVLCFFMPFFGISCAGQELVSISGTDMVWGGKPGGLLTEGGGGMGGGMGGGEKMDVPNVDPEPLAIAAFAAALIVAALAWVRNKKGAVMGAAIAGGVGFAAMIGLFVQVTGKLEDEGKKGVMGESKPPPTSDDPLAAGMEDMARDMGNSIQKDMPEIESGARWGFWLVSLMFLTLTVFAAFGLKDPGPMAQGGPPVAYQMPPQGYGPPGGMPPPG